MSEPELSDSRSLRESGSGDDDEGESPGLLTWIKNLTKSSSDGGLKESVEEILEEHEDTDEALDSDQREMLRNILDFGGLSVDDVMVPRPDVTAIDISASLEDVVEAFKEAQHSRLPVYRDTLDEVAGFVHIKDVLSFWGDGRSFSLGPILRQPLFVPHSMPAADLLVRMRTSRIHLAIVVDEYGGADGLVTIEDVVEEIIGEIEDEHDIVNRPQITQCEDGSVIVDARVELEEFEERFGLDLLPDEEDEDIDTLGGLVVSLSGRIPEPGESMVHAGLRFEVLEGDARRVTRLIVHPPQNDEDA